MSEEEVYPRTENRQMVRRHLTRERSIAVATECKIRDGYRCRVCSMTFTEVYGKIGHGFAEAHHIVPLHQLPTLVRSTPEDLVTVCSNCHRMLHKMSGKKEDIVVLQRFMGHVPSKTR
jgi:predicted HNH restriction endonuclease